MTHDGYRWEPGAGLHAVEDGRVTGVLLPAGHEDPSAERLAVARHVLVAAERPRLVRPRPPGMLAAMAAAFAREELADLPAKAVELSAADVVAWIDGPGLDVILEYCLSLRER